MKRKNIEKIYDECCDLIDNSSKGDNPCGFKCGVCINGLKNGCCRFCHLVTDEGCSSRNLTCKLFNCGSVTNNFKCLTMNDLLPLKKLSYRQRIIIKHDYFCSREEAINDLICNSIIIFTIRLVFRRIYNFIKYKKL